MSFWKNRGAGLVYHLSSGTCCNWGGSFKPLYWTSMIPTTWRRLSVVLELPQGLPRRTFLKALRQQRGQRPTALLGAEHRGVPSGKIGQLQDLSHTKWETLANYHNKLGKIGHFVGLTMLNQEKTPPTIEAKNWGRKNGRFTIKSEKHLLNFLPQAAKPGKTILCILTDMVWNLWTYSLSAAFFVPTWGDCLIMSPFHWICKK